MHKFVDFQISYKEEGGYNPKYDQQVNLAPRSIAAYEHLFDRNDGHKNKGENGLKPGECIEINIGLDEEPKMVKVKKNTPKGKGIR